MNEYLCKAGQEQKKTAVVEGLGDAIQGRVPQSVTNRIEGCQGFHKAGLVREVPSCQSLQLLLLRALPK